jgi:hypothetical protein
MKPLPSFTSKGVDGNLANWWNKKKAHPDKSLKLCNFNAYERNNPGKGDHPQGSPQRNSNTHGYGFKVRDQLL